MSDLYVSRGHIPPKTGVLHSRALIDVSTRKLTLCVEDEEVTFDIGSQWNTHSTQMILHTF